MEMEVHVLVNRGQFIRNRLIQQFDTLQFAHRFSFPSIIEGGGGWHP
jgi:hypothetical protein